MNHDLITILDHALARLHAGESVEAILRSYPQYAAELEAPLRTAAAIRQHAAQTLPLALDQVILPPQPVRSQRRRSLDLRMPRRLRHAIPVPARPQRRPLPRTLSLLTSMVIMILLGLMGATQAAAQTLPGEVLHPWKLTVEQAQIAMSPQPAIRVVRIVQAIETRVSEIQQLVRRNADSAALLIAIDLLATQSTMLIETLPSAPPLSQSVASAQLDRLLAQAEHELAQVQHDLSAIGVLHAEVVAIRAQIPFDQPPGPVVIPLPMPPATLPVAAQPLPDAIAGISIVTPSATIVPQPSATLPILSAPTLILPTNVVPTAEPTPILPTNVVPTAEPTSILPTSAVPTATVPTPTPQHSAPTPLVPSSSAETAVPPSIPPTVALPTPASPIAAPPLPNTPVPSVTVVPSLTPTPAVMPSATSTATVMPSATPTRTPLTLPTRTLPTATPTPSASATATPTPSVQPTATPTVTPSASATVTAEPTASVQPSATPTVTPSATPTPSASSTPTVTPSASATATAEPTASAQPIATPTVTPMPSATATPTVTPMPSATATPTVTPSASATAMAEPTANVQPSATPTVTPNDEDESPPQFGLRPILECVAPLANGRYRAYFGYRNDTTMVINLLIGPRNRFTPAPFNRGQPEQFFPGRTSFYPDAAFSIDFDGAPLVWRLDGRTATASRNSPICPSN